MLKSMFVAAVACLTLSSSAFAIKPGTRATPSKTAILKYVRANTPGSLGRATVTINGDKATVDTLQFVGGPIRQGQKTKAMEPFVTVSFEGKKITGLQHIDRITPLAE